MRAERSQAARDVTHHEVVLVALLRARQEPLRGASVLVAARPGERFREDHGSATRYQPLGSRSQEYLRAEPHREAAPASAQRFEAADNLREGQLVAEFELDPPRSHDLLDGTRANGVADGRHAIAIAVVAKHSACGRYARIAAAGDRGSSSRDPRRRRGHELERALELADQLRAAPPRQLARRKGGCQAGACCGIAQPQTRQNESRVAKGLPGELGRGASLERKAAEQARLDSGTRREARDLGSPPESQCRPTDRREAPGAVGAKLGGGTHREIGRQAFLALPAVRRPPGEACSRRPQQGASVRGAFERQVQNQRRARSARPAQHALREREQGLDRRALRPGFARPQEPSDRVVHLGSSSSSIGVAPKPVSACTARARRR